MSPVLYCVVSVCCGTERWHHLSGLSLQYLVLPRDGDTACDKLVVEVVVCGVKVHAFDSGELLNVQDVFTVHGPRLRERKRQEEEEWQKRKETTVRNLIILDERGDTKPETLQSQAII